MEPIQQYRKHEEKYGKIAAQLKTVKETFLNTDRERQRRLLLDSYIFAAISVQTPVDIHEDAFERIKDGEDLESALASVNYRKNKASYIRETETMFEQIDRAINALEKGKVHAAHRIIAEEFKGVSTVKAAFTLAMLGFTEKACLDTNVLRKSGIDRGEAYTGLVIQKYEDQIRTALDVAGPELPESLPSFLKQWIVFDAQRGEFTDHSVFFSNLELTL